ncbi:MAG: 4Fe-4S dicluster domain-containing protein [Planctomycetaceae bacterium]|nr:4Fe-4S dicluster domain-containing protein [Planctomycetaceae bacterium]
MAGGAAAGGAAAWGLKSFDHLLSPAEPIPHSRPGEVTVYATTCRECPAGCGMHIWHREGRINKAEGNPDHPVNRGGLCARGQSSLQGHYDPDRVRQVIQRGGAGQPQWTDALADIAARLRGGAKVLLISDLQTGTLSATMNSFARAFGGRAMFYEAVHYHPLAAACTSLGLGGIPRYRLDRADFIISFAVDFLETWLSPVEFTHDFAQMRALRDGRMGGFVYVGPRQSMTAANADSLLLTPPGAEAGVAWAMLHELIRTGRAKGDVAQLRALAEQRPRQAAGVSADQIAVLARRFADAQGSLALGGAAANESPAAGDAALAAMLLNIAAGRLGQTVDTSRRHALSDCAAPSAVLAALEDLTPKDVLIIHSTNPAFSLVGAQAAIARAGLVVCLGTMMDETASLAHWVLPIDSPLETWGDYEPWSGITGLLQPTMGRLFDTRAAGEVLREIAQQAGRELQDGPAATQASAPAPATQSAADHADPLVRGFIVRDGAGETPVDVSKVRLAPQAPAASAPQGQALLWLYPSIMLFDGRTANRGWLQESPDPISYATWSSWVDMHPTLAGRLGLGNNDVVELSTPAGKAAAPVRLTEEIDPQTVAIAFGQGHTALGVNAAGLGANAFGLLAASPQAGLFGIAAIAGTGRSEEPTYTSPTQDQHHREILQWVERSTVAAMRPGQGDDLILPLPEGYDPKRDMYPPHAHVKHRWAMVADLHRCIGCGACAVACYAENNIPVMGKARVARGREMAWLKVVPYRHESDRRRLGWLPMLCQHCDAAPCEPVCPVYAAVHNEEGLNAQVYNRCIGTRYCSNNCPYKVRRFGWFDPKWPYPLDLQLNPDVTVRCRGVMEKCTFCIQRIKSVELRATREGRAVRDGEIQPACVQSCPAGVYTFGDLLDPDSRVSNLTRRDPRRYHVLEELNTKPAVTYLRRVSQEGPA